MLTQSGMSGLNFARTMPKDCIESEIRRLDETSLCRGWAFFHHDESVTFYPRRQDPLTDAESLKEVARTAARITGPDDKRAYLVHSGRFCDGSTLNSHFHFRLAPQAVVKPPRGRKPPREARGRPNAAL